MSLCSVHNKELMTTNNKIIDIIMTRPVPSFNFLQYQKEFSGLYTIKRLDVPFISLLFIGMHM